MEEDYRNRPSVLRSPADPYMAFQFWISVGSSHGTDVAGGFSDVTGLSAESQVETLREGGVNDAELMLLGPARFPSRLVLKRGLGDPAKLWRWYQAVLSGTVTRENVTIKMLSPGRDHVHLWVFQDACPVKWTGPELRAASSAVAFESIELVHKGLLVGV